MPSSNLFFPSSSCGDGVSRPIQFYVDTVKQMAVCQLIAGSPLRTLCLLIAGQPAEVFSADNTSEISVPGAVNTPQQPAQVRYLFKNCLLDVTSFIIAIHVHLPIVDIPIKLEHRSYVVPKLVLQLE